MIFVMGARGTDTGVLEEQDSWIIVRLQAIVGDRF